MSVNRYKDSAWHKTLLKELHFWTRFAYLYIRNDFRTRTVLFYPEFPLFKTEINRVLGHSRYNITNNPRLPFDLVVAWEDKTFRGSYPLLDELAREYPVVNLDCRDISKRRVDEVFRQVFGYSLNIDPTRYRGPCVRKSNLNARHKETEILQCPIERPDAGSVYQRLLDNALDDRVVCDFRVQIYGRAIPFLNLRYKPLEKRFFGDIKAEIRETAELLTPEEVEKLLTLASLMGLDYGEIDTIRDNEDGRLYVVDVNNTPYTPPKDAGLSRRDRRLARRLGLRAFEDAFLSRPGVRSARRTRSAWWLE